MRKISLFILGGVLLTVAVYAVAGNVIQYDEKMVGAGHPTLTDTINRGFLTEHNSNGTHTDNEIAPAKLQSSSGTADNSTYYRGDGAWGTPAGGSGSTTTLPWDNITSRPTINSVTVTGAVLDNASNYPTLNQNTTGSAASYSGVSGSLSGVKLTDNTVPLAKLLTTGCTDNQVAKYTTSGGWACGADAVGEVGGGITALVEDTTPQLGGDLDLNSHVITGFTINGVAVQGTVLDNAANYPTMNQNTTGTAAALTANGANCSAGQAPLGVDAAGAVESCWTPGSAVTSLPWDNITSRPTINGVTVTGAVLDNASNYPTLNQDTTGNATTATTATALSGQYIDWSQSSGATSVANRPTINGSAVTGTRLDNAANYPTFNQNTTGNADTATRLATTGTQCTGGQFATGTDNAGNANCDTPSGSGDMLASTYDANSDNVVDSAIATAIQDNLIVNADINTSAAIDATKIADGTVTSAEFQYLGDVTSAIQAQLDLLAPLISPSFTTPSLGAATATTLNTGQGAYELYAMDQNVQTTDNVVFGTVTADEFISSALDNTRGVTVPNTADPTTTNLTAGKGWFNITSNLLKFRNGDNSATLSYYPSGTMTTTKYCIYTSGVGIVCDSTPAGGIDNIVEDTTPQLGGDLDLNTYGIDNVSQVEMEYLNGVTSGIQAQLNAKAATDQGMYIGTTSVAINRGSAAQSLTGITSIDGSAATATTAGNLSGTPALPNGTTATTQSANDNSTKLATTAYVDNRYQEAAFAIPDTALTDNTIFKGPLYRGVLFDNVVVVIQDNTGKLSTASTDNVTFNIQCGATSAFSAPDNVYTSNQTPTGAAVFSAALNTPACAAGKYIRVMFTAVNMTNKKFYIQYRWRE